MMQLNKPKPVRTLAGRYQQAEDASSGALFVMIVVGAVGLVTGGVVLLAFVRTRGMLVLVFVLMVTATMGVVITIGAMLAVKDSSTGIAREKVASEQRRRAFRRSGERSARSQTHSREALLPR